MITIEYGSGHVVGASAGERWGIAAMRAAALALRPLDKFGLSRVTRFISSLWPSQNVVRVGLTEDASFEMPYGEGYWARLLPRRWEYEGEIEAVLAAIAATDFTFIDCGANYGFWSVLASSRRYGNHPAIAIEAAPDTYAWLERNCAGNGNRFLIYNRALGDRSGESVELFGEKHEARSVSAAAAGGGAAISRVETLALDDLFAPAGLPQGARIVLKLDVEGAELATLAGASHILEHDTLLIYEDHGSDRQHSLTRHIMTELRMRVFAWHRGAVFEVRSPEQLTALKPNRRVGYNFFATRNDFWAVRLREVRRKG